MFNVLTAQFFHKIFLQQLGDNDMTYSHYDYVLTPARVNMCLLYSFWTEDTFISLWAVNRCTDVTSTDYILEWSLTTS